MGPGSQTDMLMGIWNSGKGERFLILECLTGLYVMRSQPERVHEERFMSLKTQSRQWTIVHKQYADGLPRPRLDCFHLFQK